MLGKRPVLQSFHLCKPNFVTHSSILHTCLLAAFLIFFPQTDGYAQFSGGSGTPEHPFQISTAQDLQRMKDHLEQSFVLVNDIEAGVTSTWNNGKGFEPIGSEKKPFSGSFDGQGFMIYSLRINRENKEYVGLFGFIRSGKIKNIQLENIVIKGGDRTGGIAGKLSLGSITSSSVTGSITGDTHVGGVVGFNRGTIRRAESRAVVSGLSYVGGITGINRGFILRSFAAAQVNGIHHNVGGLVGNNYDGSITESESQGWVIAQNASSVGGLSGSNGGRILRSFSSAQVKGKSYVGGLVGHNYSGSISWCYSTGAVEGFNLVGGFAGVNRNHGVILEAYTTSPVQGTVDVGGFIGVNRDPVTAGYWDKDQSGQASAVSKGSESGIKALHTSQIKGVKSFEEMPDFSFNTVWAYLPNQSPQLLWTMSYFTISDVEAGTNFVSGDLITFQVSLKNTGAFTDAHSVTLRTENEIILGQTSRITLESQQDTTLWFTWQTSLNDHGVFDLTFEAQHYRYPYQVKVLQMPEMVELKQPYDLKEHVSITPTFTWKKAFLAKNYELQISTNEEFSPLLYDIKDIDTTNYTLRPSLHFLRYYHWRVRGISENEKGPWSQNSVLITVLERPEVVAIKTPKDEDTEVSALAAFSWSETNRAENYQLQISPDDEFEKVLFDTTVSANDSSFIMEDRLPVKQQLFWRMRASNIGGNSDWSEMRSFSAIPAPAKSPVQNRIGGLEYKLDQNYPNPFNPVTNIRYSLPEATEVELRVLNMLGQTVEILVDGYQSAGTHTVVFDASKLSSGFYIYQIKTPEFTTSRKLSLVK